VPIINTIPVSIAFFSFTAGIFVLNQCFDIYCDRFHFRKRQLPVASGQILFQNALTLFLFLIISGLAIISLSDLTLIPLFLIYLCLGIFYSVPPFRLKGKPFFDIITSGIGSGILPFLIGLQVSHQLTFDFTLPWIRRRYQDAFLAIIPFFFFQCATHILQAVGDYEADTSAGITTFVVKYGKWKSIRIAELFLLTSLLLPLFYGILNLLLTNYTIWYLTLLIPSLIFFGYLKCFFSEPSKQNIDKLALIAKRAAPIVLGIIFLLALLLRISFYIE
jgi:4-hydroxybenzoate polyprenyltransferase